MTQHRSTLPDFQNIGSSSMKKPSTNGHHVGEQIQIPWNASLCAIDVELLTRADLTDEQVICRKRRIAFADGRTRIRIEV
jgi:hypothetical protein